MNAVRVVVRICAFTGICAASLLSYYVQCLVTVPNRRKSLFARYRARLTARVLRIFGARVLTLGQQNAGRGALIVANHQSVLDIGVMLLLFDGTMVSRHDVAQWPVLGRMAKLNDTIFVNRQDRRSGAIALLEIRRQTKLGRAVMAFPEGGTSHGDTVGEFHDGAFAAVRSVGAPILPLGIAYSPMVSYGDESFFKHIAKVVERKTTLIAVNYGQPIHCHSSARETANASRAAVQALVHEARKALEEQLKVSTPPTDGVTP